MANEAKSTQTVFGPGPGTRRKEYLTSILVMLAVLAVAVPVGLLAVGLLVRDLGVFGSEEGTYAFGVVLLLSILLGWSCVQGRLQFTVEATPTLVHFGGGLLRRSVGCEEIEIIQVREDREAKRGAARWLEIQARGRRRRFFLDGDEQACAGLLFEHCPSAVYIDTYGKEHRPTEMKRPLYVLDKLARDRVRRGWGTAALSPLFLVWGVPVVAALAVELLRGRQPWSKLLDYRVGFLLVMSVLGLLILLAGLEHIWRARKLVAQARRLKQSGTQDAPGV